MKTWFMNASKLCKSDLRDASEVLDFIDVVRSCREFVFVMMDANNECFL
jgi:hypothetical protein